VATGVIANGLPYGYASALVIGTLLYYAGRSLSRA
jgi:hypothetical protein